MQGLTRVFLAVLAVLFLSAATLAPAYAQSTDEPAPKITIDKRKLLVQPRNKDGSAQQVAFLEDPVLWAREQQQAFYGKMSGALRQIKSGSTVAAAWTLMLLSFGYGVFHAAGPGHGKAVISAWLLATENELRRGVLISFMSAIIQALTAIAIVSVLLLAVVSVGASARNVAGFLESASYGLIGLMGLYLIWTALRGVIGNRQRHPRRDAVHKTTNVHHFDSFQPKLSEHPHEHGPDCGCGHAHLPEARDLKGDWSLARAVSLAFAVGIRPCTGAILVLVFANAMGLYWAGIASTFAMAVGTFITVSVIAAVAVYSKKLAMRFASHDDRWFNWLGFGLRLGGGGVIAVLGAILFLGSLGATNAMM
jgi:nickel/cobalt transporter (NicO) family protein